MIETLLAVFPLLVAYVLIGIVATALTGGRDPLSFGPPIVVVAWPVVLLVAAVAFLLMPFTGGRNDF